MYSTRREKYAIQKTISRKKSLLQLLTIAVVVAEKTGELRNEIQEEGNMCNVKLTKETAEPKDTRGPVERK